MVINSDNKLNLGENNLAFIVIIEGGKKGLIKEYAPHDIHKAVVGGSIAPFLEKDAAKYAPAGVSGPVMALDWDYPYPDAFTNIFFKQAAGQ